MHQVCGGGVHHMANEAHSASLACKQSGHTPHTVIANDDMPAAQVVTVCSCSCCCVCVYESHSPMQIDIQTCKGLCSRMHGCLWVARPS
jgi:hypothetical protein